MDNIRLCESSHLFYVCGGAFALNDLLQAFPDITLFFAAHLRTELAHGCVDGWHIYYDWSILGVCKVETIRGPFSWVRIKLQFVTKRIFPPLCLSPDRNFDLLEPHFCVALIDRLSRIGHHQDGRDAKTRGLIWVREAD